MKDRKYRFEIFTLYDRTGITTHLEKMARKGWLLEDTFGPFWRYRRIEPKELTFCVTYCFSDFNTVPPEEQDYFYDLCAHTGWQLAAVTPKMHIFYNERPDPIPLETDPVLEVKKMGRWGLLNSSPLFLIWMWYMVWDAFHNDPIRLFSNMEEWIWPLLLTFAVLLETVEQLSFFLWYRRAKKAAEQGIFLENRSDSWSWRLLIGLLGVVLVRYLLIQLRTLEVGAPTMVLAMALNFTLLFLLTVCVRKALKKWEISGKIGIVITLLFCCSVGYFTTDFVLKTVVTATYHNALHGAETAEETYEYRGKTYPLYLDELPLRMEDLMEVPADSYTYQLEEEGTFLLRKWEGRQMERMDARGVFPGLSYTVLETRVGYIYDRCKEQLLQWDYTPIAPDFWGAEEAYQREFSYVLCYEERIVEILFFWEEQGPTAEQTAIIKEKLGTVK